MKQRLRRAWALDDHARALDQLRRLAGELDRSYPGAAGSLREGIEETLTLTRLGVTGKLKRTLESTNPCESMIEIVRRTQRNVKRWSSGEMALRWTAAGMLEAERQFRKIIGYRDLATLVVAIERDHDRRRHSVDAPAPRPRRPLSSSPPDHHTGTAAEIPRRAGHPPHHRTHRHDRGTPERRLRQTVNTRIGIFDPYKVRAFKNGLPFAGSSRVSVAVADPREQQ